MHSPLGTLRRAPGAARSLAALAASTAAGAAVHGPAPEAAEPHGLAHAAVKAPAAVVGWCRFVASPARRAARHAARP